jgi:hypothetical protein
MPFAIKLSQAQKRTMASQLKKGRVPSLKITNSQLKGIRKKGSGLKVKRRPTNSAKTRPRKKKTSTKTGGVLPLIPILAALSAAGAVGGGAAGIARAISSAKSNAKSLAELKRHNSILEALAAGKKRGSGLKRPAKTKKKPKKKKPKSSRGRGLFLKPNYP